MPSLHFALPLLDYLSIIRRKSWMLILIFVLVVGLTAFTTFRQSPVYEASCRIRYKRDISSALLNPGSPLFMLSPAYFDAVTFETEKYVIRSKAVAEGVVKTLGLASRENPGAWKKAVRMVRGSLSVRSVKNTRIYAITARTGDPDLAQALVNTTAAVYIDFSLKGRKESARRTFSLLTGQIDTLKAQMKVNENELLDYVDSAGGPALSPDSAPVPGKGLNPAQGAALIYNLRVQLVEQEILRGRYLNKYKENHPRVKESERQIQILKEQIESENDRIISGQKKAIGYEILQKDVRADQELYYILIKKLKELDISGGGLESNILIIEKAQRPTAPIAPRKKRNLTIGIFLGLVLGLGAIFVSSYFDPTLQTPDEVESFLDLPVLASVPRMEFPPGFSKAESTDYFFRISETHPRSREAELFKRLRTNIRFSDFGTGTIALLVTSPTPQEGKSTIASNLSSTMAQAGSRTVLIDADMRRPAVNRIFGLDNKVGLSSYLKGEAELEEIIFASKFENLSFVPSGPIPPNPSELLESPRFAELIRRLKDKFDRLVFDSPPAGALTDATIIGPLVDGVILVCFAGHVDKKFVLRTRLQLEKGGAKIFGVVLNYIELKLRSYHYYYTSVYKYGY